MLKRALFACAVLLFPVAAHAASPVVVSGGPRGGFSISPDQFVFGGQLSLAEFAPDWSFDPSAELGLGSDMTVIALNLDAIYHLRVAESEWRPYVGGGLGVVFASVDVPYPLRDHSDTEIGLNAVLGFALPAGASNHWFTEMRIGIGDLPDLKLIAGLHFKM